MSAQRLHPREASGSEARRSGGASLSSRAMVHDVTEAELPARRDRALARGPGRRRLLGRVVRPVPPARPRARGRGRASARARSTSRRSTSTPTSRSPRASASRASPPSRPSRTARSPPSSPARSRPPQVAAFFDALVPSEADRLAGAERRGVAAARARARPAAVEAAAIKLGRHPGRAATMPTRRGDLLAPFETDFAAAGPRSPALELGATTTRPGPPPSRPGTRATTSGRSRLLQEALAASDDAERTDLLRRVMVAIFTELGPASDLAREHRRRLALAISLDGGGAAMPEVGGVGLLTAHLRRARSRSSPPACCRSCPATCRRSPALSPARARASRAGAR